ncbi:MAG: hypothetical protein ABW048_05560, partial [Sphingobium sp.]
GADGYGGRWPMAWDRATPVFLWLGRIGWGAMMLLLLLQVRTGLQHVAVRQPESNGEALGALLARADLRDAIVMADPDFHLETLPYYADNPTYLLREARYGRVVHFTSRARLSLSVQDILNAAREQGVRYGKPVVILLQNPIESVTAPVRWTKGYVWTLSATPVQVRAFLAATHRLRRFDGASSDENYTAYLLPRPAHGRQAQ